MKKALLVAGLLLVGVYALASQFSGPPDPLCNPRVQVCAVGK